MVDEDIVRRFITEVSYVRTVDGFLVKLGSTFYLIEDLCRGPGCDPEEAIREFLGHPLVRQRLARLRCHWDVARGLITSDPRHMVIRKYINLLEDAMAEIKCVNPEALRVEVPDALWRKEWVEKEIGAGEKRVPAPASQAPAYESMYRKLVILLAATAIILLAVYLLRSYLPSLTRLIYGAEPSVDELRLYVLQLINDERAARNIPLLRLFPDNSVAQRHAEEMTRYNYISHWDREGRAPHIRWAMAGYTWIGVSESVGYVEYRGSHITTAFLKQQIEAIIHEMIYNDAAYNWGHRDDLLDPAHNYVAIGVAYDEDSLAVVIDSVNMYIEWSVKPSVVDGKIVFSGTIPYRFVDNESSVPVSIYVFRTEKPRPLDNPEEEKPGSWSYGELVAGVLPRSVMGRVYYPDIQTLYEDITYRRLGDGLHLSVEISGADIEILLGDGAYLVAVIGEDHVYKHPYRAENPVPLSNLVILVNGLNITQI